MHLTPGVLAQSLYVNDMKYRENMYNISSSYSH